MIPAGVRIFVCTEPIDMRYGFDRLASTARARVGEDPQLGQALFVFANRSANRIKLLWYDRNGYCLLYKRLHRAYFELPAGPSTTVCIDGSALARLLAGVARERSRRRRRRDESAPCIDLGARRKNVAMRSDALANSDA
jgi:transposase